MRKKMLLSVLIINCLGALFVGLMAAKDFEKIGRPKAKEDTEKSAEALEVKQVPIDSTKTGLMTKADSLKIKEFEREMIEEDIRFYKPKVDQYIKYLEENYDHSAIFAPEGCISGLGRSREIKAIPVLSKVLLFNPRSSYRRLAARAIRRIELYHEDQSAVPILKEASQTPDVGVQLAVLEVLIDLGEKESTTPILFSIFKKEADFFKMSREASIDYVDRADLPYSEQVNLAKGLFEHCQSLALKMLIEIGNEKVVEGLEQCLNAQDEWIREKAQNALEKMAKQARVDTTNSLPMTEAEMQKVHQEMIEEYRRRCLPLLPKRIEFLEQNYKNTRDLGLAILDLARIRDLKALPVMIKILTYNPRGINRADAADGIRIIEEYNGDDSANPALVQALDDTITDVQFNAAKALVSLGDTLNPIMVLTRLARGENKENWTVDWAGYMGLENATEEEIEEEKKKFKDRLQSKAIGLLGELSTKEAIAVLKDLSAHADEGQIRKRAQETLKRALNECHQDIQEPIPKNAKNGVKE